MFTLKVLTVSYSLAKAQCDLSFILRVGTSIRIASLASTSDSEMGRARALVPTVATWIDDERLLQAEIPSNTGCETDIIMMDEEAAGVRRLGAGEQRRNFDVKKGDAVREEA